MSWQGPPSQRLNTDQIGEVRMRIAVLGATGPTGRQLVSQALGRGHTVVALARNPRKLVDLKHSSLEVVRADVFEPATVRSGVSGADAVVSGLGIGAGDAPGALSAGARALSEAGARHVVWLGALGTGESRGAGGPVLNAIVRLFLRKELSDKVSADDLVRAAGASVVHAGPLNDTTGRRDGRLVAVEDVRGGLLAHRISRVDLAALMLDEAARPRFQGSTAVARTG
jgi:putative NADH-flavin reductase